METLFPFHREGYFFSFLNQDYWILNSFYLFPNTDGSVFVTSRAPLGSWRE